MKTRLLCALLLASATFFNVADANMTTKNPSEDAILTDLSRCDATFFTTLKNRMVMYSDVSQYKLNENYAYFRVPNRFGDQTSTSPLTPSIKIGSLEAVAYFDEIWSIRGGGLFLAWGFVINANLEDVIRAIRPLIWDNQRLVQENPSFTRSELWEKNKDELGWQKIQTESGAPKPDTAERVLMIESYERASGQTRVGCSLQGFPTKQMIESIRPDLSPKSSAQ